MHFSTSFLTTAAVGILTAGQALACCNDGCYSVKGEGYRGPGCQNGGLVGASIANFGSQGPCVDITDATVIQAHNDGCGSSRPRFQFFSDPSCTTFVSEVLKSGGGECFAKSENFRGMIVISD